MPMSKDFSDRLTPILEEVSNHYGTPFHIYDEKGIKDTGEKLKKAFSGVTNLTWLTICTFDPFPTALLLSFQITQRLPFQEGKRMILWFGMRLYSGPA